MKLEDLDRGSILASNIVSLVDDEKFLVGNKSLCCKNCFRKVGRYLKTNNAGVQSSLSHHDNIRIESNNKRAAYFATETDDLMTGAPMPAFNAPNPCSIMEKFAKYRVLCRDGRK